MPYKDPGHPFKVIIYCNKKQHKVVDECRTLKAATKKYMKYIEEVKPPFHQETKKSRRVEYFIAVISEKEKKQKFAYVRDSLGRNVTMNVKKNQSVMKVSRYYLPEKIYDNEQKKHVSFENILSVLNSEEGLKYVYKLNSHLFIETDNHLYFYSLKNIHDCERLINTLILERLHNGITDCLYARDGDRSHRKYLYERLKKYGYPLRGKLYKHYSR